MTDFTADQIGEKTEELVADMAAGNDIYIGEYRHLPWQYMNKLIEDGAYPADLAILAFSKAEMSDERVEAWRNVSVFVERWAVECLEFEADEAKR